jgi:hypothetical protein
MNVYVEFLSMLRIHPGTGFAPCGEYFEILVDDCLDWQHVFKFISLSVGSKLELTTDSFESVPISGSVIQSNISLIYYRRPRGVEVGTQTYRERKIRRRNKGINFPPFGVSSVKYLSIRRRK